MIGQECLERALPMHSIACGNEILLLRMEGRKI